VTDPEPLPAGHPLWDLPNCLITPHTADTEQMTEPLLAARITENVRRLAAGDALEGRVDPDLGNLVAKADLQNSKSGFPGSCFHREIFHGI
jgi:phosphoglycerate dehydrogenase-like enzyme